MSYIEWFTRNLSHEFVRKSRLPDSVNAEYQLEKESKMKHPQSILAVEAQPFVKELNLKEGFNVLSEDLFLRAATRHFIVALRDQLDNKRTELQDVVDQINYIADLHGIELEFKNPPPLIQYNGDRTKLQLLPYLVFVEHGYDGNPRIARYQRGKGVGESRLAGNNSIGYGGHPDLCDVLTNADILNLNGDEDLITEEDESTVNVRASLYSGMRREIEEEVEKFSQETPTPSFMGLILDRSNDVGHLHLGVVYGVDLFVGEQAIPREEQLIKLDSLTVQELVDDENLESWSKIIAQHLLTQVNADA